MDRRTKKTFAKDGDNHVLAQKAKNDDPIFNVALADGTNDKDLDLSVRMKAVEGETDRGGGLVWRAKDKNNCYICRYNPLRGASYRVYKLVDGKKSLEADDSTFPDAGKIGLWSKSDARSYFDDLSISE
jgi:hypothetical protein